MLNFSLLDRTQLVTILNSLFSSNPEKAKYEVMEMYGTIDSFSDDELVNLIKRLL